MRNTLNKHVKYVILIRFTDNKTEYVCPTGSTPSKFEATLFNKVVKAKLHWSRIWKEVPDLAEATVERVLISYEIEPFIAQLYPLPAGRVKKLNGFRKKLDKVK